MVEGEMQESAKERGKNALVQIVEMTGVENLKEDFKERKQRLGRGVQTCVHQWGCLDTLDDQWLWSLVRKRPQGLLKENKFQALVKVYI